MAAAVVGIIVATSLVRLRQLERRDAAETRAVEELRTAGGKVDEISQAWDTILGIKTYVVDFRGIRTTDAALRPLEDIGRLFQVALSDSGVADAGLSHLAGRTDLEHLLLDNGPVPESGAPRNRITDGGLRHLEGMRRLFSLALSGSDVTDDGLRHLAGLPRLTVLEMNRCRIEGPGLAHLGRLPHLEVLWLDDNPITDEGLRPVGDLEGLTFLSLVGTSVTDAGLRHLYGLQHLRQLRLDVSRFSPRAITELRRAMPPDLKIIAIPTTTPGIRPAAPPPPGDASPSAPPGGSAGRGSWAASRAIHDGGA
jgi:hypothetical protein